MIMANYGDLPAEHSNYDSASIVIIPVPYDQTSTWIKGADKGPDALIEASANMELYDIETDSQVYKKGIFTDKAIIEKSSPEAMVNAVEKRVTKLIKQNKFVIVIGGEHSVSIGSIKAHSQYFKDLTVLQLDAHADTREQYHGSAYNHACVMARARENAKIVQVGIRSIDAEEINKIDPESMFLAEDIYNSDNWAEKVISRLSENVYVTIDLDVFDPSIMPSTGTPEPGGLLWYDILKLLKNVAEKKHIVGFDVVELCPKKDDKAPDFLAAKLIYKFLSYRFGN
ncbi:MAG: agmatinase [Planctomycetes bacterium]|nr:agmatinase [Planctomycetota bacterium]MBL7106854.1 agmatinase [Phycisphaerae bacterium]